MKYAMKVREQLEEKLIDFTIKNDVSVSDLFSDFETRISNLKSIYYKPREHLSKIYLMAYKGTMKKYSEG